MNRYSRGLLATCSGIAGLAIVATAFPEPAHAQFGGIIGAMLRGFGGGGGHHYSRHSSRREGCGRKCRSRGDDTADSSDSSDSSDSGRKSRKERNDRVLASLAPPSKDVQNQVLKNVYVSKSIGEVGTTKDTPTLGRTDSKEADRDWTGRVDQIIRRVQDNQDKRITTPGDVTQHAIEQSLDKAIKNAKLDRFETCFGED